MKQSQNLILLMQTVLLNLIQNFVFPATLILSNSNIRTGLFYINLVSLIPIEGQIIAEWKFDVVKFRYCKLPLSQSSEVDGKNDFGKVKLKFQFFADLSKNYPYGFMGDYSIYNQDSFPQTLKFDPTQNVSEFNIQLPCLLSPVTQETDEVDLNSFVPSAVDQFSIDNPQGLISKFITNLKNYSTPKKDLPDNKNNLTDSKKMKKAIAEFHRIVFKHRTLLRKTCFAQFKSEIIHLVVNNFLFSNHELDHSTLLFKPFIDYQILLISGLDQEIVNQLFDPIFSAFKFLFSKNHSPNILFGLTATSLNFGLLLSTHASEIVTNFHLPILEELQQIISVLILVMVQKLVGTVLIHVSSNGLIFAGEEAIQNLKRLNHLFLDLYQKYKLPDFVIQLIAVGCCKQLDVTVFNIIIDTASVFNESICDSLLEQTRDLQKAFTIMSQNFSGAFSNVQSIITTTQSLMSGFDSEKLKQDPLYRSIAERCPAITLPPEMSKGKNDENRLALKVAAPPNPEIFIS